MATFILCRAITKVWGVGSGVDTSCRLYESSATQARGYTRAQRHKLEVIRELSGTRVALLLRTVQCFTRSGGSVLMLFVSSTQTQLNALSIGTVALKLKRAEITSNNYVEFVSV